MKHLVFMEPDRLLHTALESHYSLSLVVLSFLVAGLASYVGFLIAERVRTAKTRPIKLAWLLAGTSSLGSGIWAMNFIGLLALKLPVAVHYDVMTTLFSIVPAILTGLVILIACCETKHHTRKWLLNGVFMGSGISLMHYIGMAAMDMSAVIRYEPLTFSLSIVVAIILSLLSLRIKMWVNSGMLGSLAAYQSNIIAALGMGGAITTVHYTSMASAVFFPAQVELTTTLDWDIQFLELVIGLLVGAVLILLTSTIFAARRLALMDQLQTSETQLNEIFNTILDGLITIDEKGVIKSFNPAAEKIFAYQKEEVIGHNISKLMPDPDCSQHDGYLRDYLETGNARIIGYGREVQGRRKDGSLFFMELAINELKDKGRRLFTGIIRDVSERKQAEATLKLQQQQIEIVHRAQASFIASGDPVKFFEGMLPDILALTQSEYGLIGEAMRDEQGQCYLKAYAVSNIAWDDATRKFYEENAPQGLEFRNVDNLFSKVITEGMVIISNSPASDPRSAGIPEKHPPLNAFLGLPIYLGDELLGMIGVANRPGGYDEAVAKQLQPILNTCAQLLDALRKEREKRRVARELNRTNSFMSALIENLQAGLLVENEDGEVYAVNQTYCDMFGREEMPLRIEGSNCAQEFAQIGQLFIEPELFLQQLRECQITQGVVSGVELALTDGRIYELAYVPIILEDEQGEIHRNHLWSFHDISEHKEIELQLRQQGQELEQAKQDEHALAELLKLALQPSSMKVFLDASLQTLLYTIPWLRLNPKGAVFLTAEENNDEVLLLTVEHAFDPELLSLCAKVPFGKCLCGRAAADRAIQFTSCIDEQHEISYEGMTNHGHFCLPLLQDDKVLGVMTLYLAHGHETSSQELDFLEQVSEVIAMGISRRYASRALVEAKQQAEQGAKAKSQFLATMSHEIRTPMNGVLGMLHLLGKTQLNEKQRRFVGTATSSGEMLLTVINDVLDFSKLEADKLQLESIPFDPLTLVEESVILMAKAAQEKGLELISAADHRVPLFVRGDPTRLRQILTNLISNAIKFTEQGDVVVYVSPVGKNSFHFGVRDTGIGISPEQQSRLFQSFTQVDSSHTRKYGGTGLGLVICQRLVAAMGGEIRVASAQGIGTDFSFELSLQEVDQNTSPQRQQASTLLPQQRILVVDDNDTNREVLSHILTGWQITQVGQVENGLTALTELHRAAACGQPYDIALLDMHMPGMTGLELAQTIRQEPALRTMRLVMLSSVDRSESAPELDAWLTKPVRQSDLYNSLLLLVGEVVENPLKTIEPTKSDAWWFGGRKLLLVEDNPVNQEVAREILGEVGFSIDIRENGAEGVQAVQEQDYDAVLMDIQMPVMDGLEATRQIRALGERFDKLPIIAMTAHALTGDSDKSLAAGMSAHVTKPIDPDTVFRTLAQWLQPSSQKRPSTDTNETIGTTLEIPDLPGIDVADGLARLLGNWTSYRRILLSFRDRQAGAMDQLEQFIAQNEWDEAARLAHTLKGSSGNLGAKQLYEAASVMEQACRNSSNDEASQAGLLVLRTRLTEVIDGLARLDAQNNGQTRAVTAKSGDIQPIEPNVLRTSLEKIVQFMDSDLGEAQACLATLQQQVMGSDYAVPLNELENALNIFDIEAAKVIAQQISSTL